MRPLALYCAATQGKIMIGLLIEAPLRRGLTLPHEEHTKLAPSPAG